MMILSVEDPGPTVPMFEEGEIVRAPNGQNRMVKSMQWSHAEQTVVKSGRPPHMQPRRWGWVLTTVPPGEPDSADIGQGFEDGYSRCK